jgi:PIN domain nuclease of toxin-antitoxin system
MRILADTNLFIKFCLRLPLPKRVESALLDESTDRHLSPASIMEVYRLWQKGIVPDHPDTWLELALPSWTILPITVPIARQSILWPWPHKDPADRLIAATASHHNIALWHTDTVLRRLSGFPQKYFVNLPP